MPVLLAGEAFFYFGPVDYVPPSADVIGAAVLVLQVVGVLPHVQAHHREFALHYGTVLVRGRDDVELARAIADQPGPAGSDACGRGRAQLLFELIEAAERALNGVRQRAARSSAGLGGHDGPEHGMVDVPAAIVAHGRPDVFRNDGAIVGE